MDWNAIKTPEGSKLFSIHKFTYMHQGVNYLFEINEAGQGIWIGHGEHSTDQSNVIPPVNGSSLEDCINQLIDKINHRSS